MEAERENTELFKLFLQAASLQHDMRMEVAAETFLAPLSNESLALPWKSPLEMLSLFDSLSSLIEGLILEPSDLIAREEEVYYSCSVRGQARRTGRPVLWKFAGRVRFRRPKITACVLYTDFISLFKQVGSLPGEEAQGSGAVERESAATKSQAELNEFEIVEKFLRLYDASHLAAVVTNLEDKILDLNEAFADLLGQEASVLRDSPLDRLIFPADLELNEECRRRLQEGRALASRVELRFLRSSSVVWA